MGNGKEIKDVDGVVFRIKPTQRFIKGSGGIRKLRWAGSGRGKRGGMRVIYYFFKDDDQIYMLYAYPQSKKDDLTADQLKQLKQLVEGQLL